MLKVLLSKQVIAPICIIAGCIVIYIVLHHIIKRMFQSKHMKNKRQQTLLSVILNIIKYFLLLVAVLMILDVYGVDTKALLASVGIIGVVAGLALQDLLKDFIAGISIIFENQYGVGDVVTISSFKGEVTALGIRTTQIKAYTGEIKVISNRMITEVINYSIGKSLAIVNVSVLYEEDIEKVRAVLDTLCTEMSEEIPDLVGKIECLGINDLKESGIEFQVVGEAKPTMQFGVQREMRRRIKLAFDKKKIAIAYPQLVIHHE